MIVNPREEKPKGDQTNTDEELEKLRQLEIELRQKEYSN